ncbi:MAG: hypothetical protein AB1705_28415, partial [Verrucomicrobiota bacterium]
MIDALLKTELEPIARRHRQWRLWLGLSAVWAAGAVLGGILIFAHETTRPASWILGALLVATGIAALIVWIRSHRWHPDFREVARRIESQHPNLHALLLTAVEQKPDPGTGNFTYLQERVIQEALGESRKHEWLDTVSTGKLGLAFCTQVATFLLFLGALTALRDPHVAASVIAAARGVQVTPGDAEVERGTGLVVLARFTGKVPAEATLVITPSAGAVRRVALVKNLDDPVFGTSLAEVKEDLSYRVEFSGGQTRDFKLSVFEYPALERADAKLEYPEYTKLQPKVIEETRRVSAVEGTKLEYTLRLNKPV